MSSLPPLVDPVPALPAAEQARTARQTRLPEFGEVGQRRLAGAKVLVVGAGGLGAPVLQYLAAAGVGSISIIDDDVVEASNLHRQVIHSHRDLGRSKAENAREQVLGLNPHAQVRLHQVRLTEANAHQILGGHHLVLDGTDTFPTRYLVADTCAELGIPLVWGSVLRFDAQVSLFWSDPPAPAQPVRMRDLYPHPPAPGEVPSCAEAGVIGSLCGIAGSIMATEAIKLITGMGEVLLGRIAVIDALSMRIHEVPLDTSGPPASASPPQRTNAVAAAPAPATTPAAITTLDLAGFQDRRTKAEGAVVLLDVREPDEAEQDALPGAVNLPISTLLQAARGHQAPAEIQALLRQVGLDDRSDLLTYCSAGVRAARATRLLVQAGWSSAVLPPEVVDALRAQPELV